MSPDLLAYVRSLAVVYQAGTLAGVECRRAGEMAASFAAHQAAADAFLEVRGLSLIDPEAWNTFLVSIADDQVRAIAEEQYRLTTRTAPIARRGLRHALALHGMRKATRIKTKPSENPRGPVPRRPERSQRRGGRAPVLARRDAAQAPPAYAVPRALSRGIAPRVIAERPTRRSLAPMA